MWNESYESFTIVMYYMQFQKFYIPPTKGNGNSEGKGVAQNNAISARVGGSKTGDHELWKTNSFSVKQAIS